MTAPLFIARHGETVFNAAARMQGSSPHTPLTRTGFAQADAMGRALRHRLGPSPALELWSSPAGRALQTLAVITEHLALDWHGARIDARLGEIDVGDWSGLYYRDVITAEGDILDRDTGLFNRRPPGGETYGEVADRLRSWLSEHPPGDRARLVVMHGMSSRVLRGLLLDPDIRLACGTGVAAGVPQGRLVEITDGVERLVDEADKAG